ncbi:uncharacterized protein DUF2853 [Litorimonas taeanensis]|uniref:Uncharacterized protein DUF2853 n=1 Tax=Litorimonas taeanensis TaxID=568099 RepID=A0A420WLC7_9PROT|nr:DUF2853 family protein [Litorimonas taeanensis]RKQ71827.1 uncharacterized protein DUF2853 [Litorimonas taeanensis]
MSTKTLEKKLKPLTTARRAYIGLHGFAYDRAKLRSDQASTLVKNLFETCVSHGEKVETQFNTLSSTVKTDVSEKLKFKMPKRAFKTSNSTKKVAELEAKIERLNAQIDKLSKPMAKKAKPQKTQPAKAAVTKNVQKETPAPKTQPASATADTDKYAPYLADVQRFDAAADISVVRKIVIHCGIALRNNDGRFVACSDETERHTVRNSWLIKKLGLEDETDILDAKVQAVCETMKSDNKKNRVTFYYLLAKNEGRLASL